jgi:methanogenic corrinoid protein MtbC1
VLSLLHAAPENERARHAVLACLPEEEHEMGLLGVALRLRHAGMRVTLLGQKVPAADLGRLVATLRPDLVGLSAVTDLGVVVFENTLARVVEALPKGSAALWVGGPAAQAHGPVCERWGARVFRSGDDWAALLS